MVRYHLKIEYDGRPYVGWQRQEKGMSVQQSIEEAVIQFSGEPASLFVAGRTDKGVHALYQSAHLDLTKDWSIDRVRDALNAKLRPHPISILSAEIVDEEFHARFSAKERAYMYRITNRRSPLTVDRGLSWWVPVPLDLEPMRDATEVLLGKHDFSTFRATACQANSPVKTLDQLDVTWEGQEIRIYTRARSFLYHQVRNIVGSLKMVGSGKWTKDDLKKALDAKDRRAGGPTVPADGLYLTNVVY
ncbi:MAG: tRNA pseudouridine(38-40) synthase TruA [Rhodospirillales bacterium]|mgnify:FL=1|jgi:tRNA pseudouridine38-40 synthase|tara:strand:+ start:106 stop:843 length:738 start_codon:yes stop_codon:yes gene_type:complete